MSVYSELLRVALSDDMEESGAAELVSRAVALRPSLDLQGDAPTRLARNLAYDVTLIRLCEVAGLEHRMTDDIPETIARQEAEALLAERFPAMRSVLLTNQKGL
jgi:hypothetical protein